MPKVLVVDDSLSVRKVVEKALAGRSMEVMSAASGAEAIERIERDRPDIVVCDVILPDKDGYQVCQFVRTHPTIGRMPVLLISGVVDSTVLARAAEVQSNDVMFKPFAAEQLVRKIDALLAGVPNGAAPAPAVSAPHPPAAPVAVASRPAAASPAPGWADAGPETDLKTRLTALAGASGVRFVALADREGFLIESAGDTVAEIEVAAALAACLGESSEGIGRELGQGSLQGMMLEYESATLLLHGVGPDALLAVLVADSAALGKIRYLVKRALSEIQQEL
ncbi:MAG TPA: response regulator [Methylomirabilota bacterium]|nr:response regulator [Methylomirabilota bacterium]